MGSMIEIDKNLIPYEFEISLSDELFAFEINYNPDFDFFSIDLRKEDADIVLGEKVIYGTPLFTDIVDARLPKVTITPYDESGKATEVVWSTLSETVFLYVEGDSE